ncbi:MAG: tetratricopeptide repeat protein, partial [Deltaproteobacteria bacterium]|nr:tetratricopeptide repeat protein [Deltaproteobacteria bacterium]
MARNQVIFNLDKVAYMRPLALYKTLMQERRWGDVSALIETLTLGKKTNDADVSAFDIASLWFSLGLAALLDNAHAEAAHAFGESLRQTPDNAEIFPHLGMALQGLHKPLEAAPWYRKALAVNPEDLTSRQNLMRCLLSGGSLAEAENLLQTWPDKFVAERDLAAMYLLEVLLWRMGLRDEARKSVNRYIHSFGPSPLLETQLSLYIPPILEASEEADTLRQNIRNFFRSAKDYPNLGHPMTVQGMPPFHLAFHGKDDRELLETWADFLQRHTTLGTSPFTPIPDEASAPIPAEVKKEDVRRRITA